MIDPSSPGAGEGESSWGGLPQSIFEEDIYGHLQVLYFIPLFFKIAYTLASPWGEIN